MNLLYTLHSPDITKKNNCMHKIIMFQIWKPDLSKIHPKVYPDCTSPSLKICWLRRAWVLSKGTWILIVSWPARVWVGRLPMHRWHRCHRVSIGARLLGPLLALMGLALSLNTIELQKQNMEYILKLITSAVLFRSNDARAIVWYLTVKPMGGGKNQTTGE